MTQENLVQKCILSIKDAIIRGELRPGEKLKVIPLKEWLQTGATPVREALSFLSTTGLVEAEANKGFRVKTISQVEVRDVYKTYAQIEALAITQAIEYGDTSWEADILAALHRLSVVENSNEAVDPLVWLQANNAFHRTLISGCQSPCLLKVRDDLYQLFDRYCHLSFFINQSELSLNHDEHKKIAKAVISRNKEMAIRLLDKHLEGSFKQVFMRLKQGGLI